jgi:S1-C subfamily serine protease
MKFKYLLLILFISIIAAAQAADWRYGVVRGSDNKQVDIDYQSVLSDSGLIVFQVRFPPEKGLMSIFSSVKYNRETYAVDCASNKAKYLSHAEIGEDGLVEVNFLRTINEADFGDVPEGSMLSGLKEKICKEFSASTPTNNYQQKTNRNINNTNSSSFAPNGIVASEWIAITENGAIKYYAKKETLERSGDVINFITGRDLGSEIKSTTGKSYRFEIENSTINCKTNTYSSSDSERFDSSGVFIEIVKARNIDKTPHLIESEVGKKYKDLMCQIDTKNNQSQSNDNSSPASNFATGTAWQISKSHVVTAYHVVEGAKSIAVMINEEDARSAIVVSFDQHNDLAILKIDGSPLQSKSISLAGNQAKIGSNIAVLGFPLPELLGTKLQANTGEISSHHGLRNDPRFYRITANVQGGNSGGPVLNQYGEAIGVVSSKLNDLTTLKNKGELPQNINFAVKNHYLKSLIEAAHIKTSNYPKKIKPIDDVIEDFKRSVFLVITETKE